MKPISYDPAAVFKTPNGLEPADLEPLVAQLESIRDEVAEEDVRLLEHPEQIPDSKQPLDSAFLRLPEKLLADYEQDRKGSELGRILTVAKRLQEQTDRVIVLGIGGSYMGPRALMEACCQPYFNELSRAQRGGRPRMYFEGNNLDNDASQGLLDLLSSSGSASLDDQWAIVVISKSGGTIETAVAFRQFLAALQRALKDDPKLLKQRVVPVTGTSGRLFDLAAQIGCDELFQVPEGVGGRFSILSPVGLLPAAVLGLDVVELLRGAALMNQHFRETPFSTNHVLQYVGVSHCLEKLRGAEIRVLSVWAKALESVGLWYDQLLAESLGKQEKGATPLTTVNTRDLHSRAQQHQEGRRDKLFTNLVVQQWRTDPLPVGHSEWNQDQLNDIADKTLPELMQAAVDGTNQAYQDAGKPTADICLPQVDEGSLGQLFQMLMLATVVEGRLLDINPYGQPGVEAYKRNMQAILGR